MITQADIVESSRVMRRASATIDRLRRENSTLTARVRELERHLVEAGGRYAIRLNGGPKDGETVALHSWAPTINVADEAQLRSIINDGATSGAGIRTGTYVVVSRTDATWAGWSS